MEGRAHGEIALGGETLTGKTKPGEKTTTKLKRIAERSGEDPQAEFNWLMPHFNEESLIGCFNELDGEKAVGADGQRPEFTNQIADRIRPGKVLHHQNVHQPRVRSQNVNVTQSIPPFDQYLDKRKDLLRNRISSLALFEMRESLLKRSKETDVLGKRHEQNQPAGGCDSGFL